MVSSLPRLLHRLPKMNLRQSIDATTGYAAFFNYPLFPEEIHRWLICSKPTTLKKVLDCCGTDLTPTQKDLRSKISTVTAQKTQHARKLAGILKFVPGVRLMALTGSVAAQNSHPGDDIDLFFITSPHTLWLVRPVVLFLTSIFFRRRYPGEDHSTATDAFCPNLWLDATALALPRSKRNLYTAHEVLQIVPLLDRGNTYQSFLYQNRWVKKYLANAYDQIAHGSRSEKGNNFSVIFSPFNLIFFFLQILYMRPKKTTETVHLHGAFLHTTDFASKIDQYLDVHQDI